MIARLTYNNIKFIKELTKDGVPYEYYVAMKTGNVSDGRFYARIDERGRVTDNKEYPFEKIPSTVQKFLENHTRELFSERDDHATYIYQ